MDIHELTDLARETHLRLLPALEELTINGIRTVVHTESRFDPFGNGYLQVQVIACPGNEPVETVARIDKLNTLMDLELFKRSVADRVTRMVAL